MNIKHASFGRLNIHKMISNPQVEGNCTSCYFVTWHKVTCRSLFWIRVPVGECVVEEIYGNQAPEQRAELSHRKTGAYTRIGARLETPHKKQCSNMWSISHSNHYRVVMVLNGQMYQQQVSQWNQISKRIAEAGSSWSRAYSALSKVYQKTRVNVNILQWKAAYKRYRCSCILYNIHNFQ